MRYLSVCSGIEAASVAWHPLGWEAVAFSEIEAFPCAVLEHRWPGVPNLGDMTRIEGEKYRGAVDVLIGGTPCQDFSIAGKRAGLSGERSGLALHFARLVRDIQPRWIVWENVPGAFSTNRGQDFCAFAGGLAELGYGLAWRVLDAQYWGVPQRRRRIYLVGYLGDVRPAGAVLFERESLRRHTPPCREKGKDVAGTLASRAEGGGGLGTDFECSGGLQVTGQPWPADTASCLNAHFGDKMGLENQHINQGAPLFVPAPVCQYGDKANALTARHDSSPCADRGMTIVGTLAASGAGTERPAGQGNELDFCIPTLVRMRSGCEGGGKGALLSEAKSLTPATGNDQVLFEPMAIADDLTPKTGDRAFTLTQPSPSGGGRPQAVLSQMRVRRLTPRECERLQGFPDDYTLIEYRGRPAADGPRYKALGNSMAVPVVRWVGERIARAEELLEG